MFDKIKSDTVSTMDKSIESFKNVLGKIRAGRPNPSILDQVMADYFNTPTCQTVSKHICYRCFYHILKRLG